MIASVLPMRIATSLAAGLAGLAILAGVLHAAGDDDDEDEMDYFPLVPSGSQLRFGLHFVGGPKVAFGNLGIVPTDASIGGAPGIDARTYDDGAVNLDQRKDANGNPVNDGLTDNWNYQSSGQITASGDIAFHAYSTTSLGAGESVQAIPAGGWELVVGKSLGKIAGKVNLSLMAGISFSNIDAKTSGVVNAQLTTVTDVYPLYGQTPPTAPYSAPTFTSQVVYDANGNPVLDSNGNNSTTSVENSTLLGNQPSRTVATSITQVQGYWQIKGAYYTLRLGPMLEIPITERLKFSVGAGAAVALSGTRYIVDETIVLVNVPAYPSAGITTSEETEKFAVLPLFYADADAEYWLTERSGFYFGADFQKSGSYEQTLGGRTANVDLGTTYGVSTGLTLRF
jgi:hypothetical protein